MSDDEQPDDHLSLIAKANGKAPHDRHDVMHLQTVSGPVIDNRNQISTPALVIIQRSAKADLPKNARTGLKWT